MNAPLHIAIVTTEHGWRGGEEQARQLALGLRSRAHNCTIIATPGSQFADRMGQEGFTVETFRGNGKGVRSILSLRSILKRLRPEVVHFNDSRSITTGGIAAWGLGLPLRIASRRVDFPIRSSWKYRKLAERVICVSHAVAKICEQGGIPAQQLCVVHDGVEPSRMAAGDRQRGRQALGLSDDQRLLLNVAALTAHKGHRFLLAALPELLESRPELVVAICGDGELDQALREQAKQLGIESRVRFLGYRTDVPDLMHACDLFVMSSVEEGLGTTVIDAMFARRPIVATTAGGIPELLSGGDDSDQPPLAWTVPPADEVALRDAISSALVAPAECAQMVDRAASRAAQRFTADAMVEATLAVYRDSLAR